MIIDREELRRLWRHVLIDPHSELAVLRTAVPDAIDALDAKDQRIAVLEKQVERFVAIVAACDEHGEVGRTVDALATARARIRELEAGLAERNAVVAREFLDLGAANQQNHALTAALTDLYKIAKLGSGPVSPASAEAIERARRLLPSEET